MDFNWPPKEGGGGSGTVTEVSVVTANGLAGSVADPTTTPAITLSTTVTGVLMGDGTAISAQTVGNLTESTSSVLTITGGTGAVLGSGASIQVKLASGSQSGYLSSTDWTTFNSKQSALTIGDITDSGTDGITITGGTGAIIGSGVSIAQHVADSTHNGYLSSTDWSTFNNKGSGSVTSVAMTVPSILSVSGSPITGSGTLALTYSGTALPIANGGTNSTTSLNNNRVMVSSAGKIAESAAITADSALISDSNGLPVASSTTSIQIGYLSTLTSNVQTQLNNKQTVTLASGKILVGNVSNLATAQTMTGDIAIDNAGATTYNGTVPLNKGGTGQTSKAAAFDALSPMTTGGDLIYGGASGTGTRLANGSAGQVLTSAGGTSAPTWTNSGSLVLLQTQTASSSATIDFTTGISSTYDQYVLVISDVLSATNAVEAWIRVSTDGGSTWKSGASDYAYVNLNVYSASNAASAFKASADTKIILQGAVASSAPNSFTSTVKFFAPSNSSRAKIFQLDTCHYASDGNFYRTAGTGSYVGSTTAINGIRFLMSSGNIASGTFSLYGIRK